MSHGLRKLDEPRPGGHRVVRPAVGTVPSRRAWPPTVPRRRGAIRRRPTLARPRFVLRILPRRQRPWLRGQPSDRLDRPGRPVIGQIPPPFAPPSDSTAYFRTRLFTNIRRTLAKQSPLFPQNPKNLQVRQSFTR